MKIRILIHGCGKKIHEMQIFKRINGRSIFCCLISVELWLIVLLLCNYPEFAQGLDGRAAGCSKCLFSLSPCGPTCKVGLWRLANPPASILALSLAVKAAWSMSVDEMK